MAMGRSDAVQNDLMATWAEMPRSPGHAFYDRLQELLSEAGFDAFVEQVCKPYYAPRMGAPSLAAGAVFPDAYDRLFRRSSQRARHRLALRGLVLSARLSAPVEPRQGPRSVITHPCIFEGVEPWRVGDQARVARITSKGFAPWSRAVSTLVRTSASASAAHMAR